MDNSKTSEATFARGRDLDELRRSEQDLVEQGWQAEGPVIENNDGTLSRKMTKV